MSRILHVAAAALAITTAWALSVAGCSSDLTATTPGHDQCDATGQCLAGFVCDRASNSCVSPGVLGDASADADAGEPIPDAGSPDGCAADACAPMCTADQTDCGGVCVTTADDPAHCGTCAKACAAPVSGAATGAPACASGGCDVTCDAATPTACNPIAGGKACVATKTDPQFCGNCTTQCPGGTTCSNGACVTACAPGLSPCGSSCVNLQTDPYNCSTCSNACPALLGGANNKCDLGGCKAACDAGLTACTVSAGLTSGAACVDLQKDPTHCGACGTACTAGQICAAGACKPYVLASGCWECGNGNSLPLCCPLAGQTVCTNAAVCP
jgi:hypothetical protein